MKFFIIVAFIAGFSNTFFALFVLMKDRKSFPNKLFGLFSMSFALWAFSYGIWLLQESSADALFWSRMLNLGATFIPILVVHWILSVLDKKNKKILIFGYIITFIFALLSFSSYYIKGSQPIFIFPFWPQAGILYTIYLFTCYVGFFGYGFYKMFKVYKDENDKLKKRQIEYLFLGSLVSILGGATNFPLMYNIPFLLPYGMCLVIFHPLIFTYAIFKHHLFNIKVITTELFSMILFIILSIRFALSETTQEFLSNGVMVFSFAIFAVLLIQSVWREVKTREKIEILAKDLEEVNVKLTEASRQKSEFLSIASHQFRSPLAAIKGYASLILEGSYGNVNEKIKQPIRNMFDSTNNLALIVDDFLNVSRIEQGRMEYKFENVKVNEIIENVINEMKPSIDESGLEFSFNYDKTDNYDASIDTSKFRQVIINLIDNSLKYTKKGWLKIELKKNTEKKILFKISDSGVGISKQELPQLFTLFKRAGNANKVNVKGTGLGLYIVKKIMEAHGGKVWAKSEGEDKGAQFYVEIQTL